MVDGPEPETLSAEHRRATKTFSRTVLAIFGVVAAAFVIDAVVRYSSAPTWLKIVVAAGTALAAIFLWLGWRSYLRASRRYWARYAGLPDGTALVNGRASRRSVIGRETTARFGVDVGNITLLMSSQLLYTRLSGVICLTAVLGYLNGYGGIFDPAWFLSWLAFCVIVLGFGLLSGSSIRRVSREHRGAIESELGIPYEELLPLPGTPAEYTAWCAAHSLQPYPSGEPDWTDLASMSSSDA